MPRPRKPSPETRFLPAQRKAIVTYNGATVELVTDDAGVVHATVDQVRTVKDGPNGDLIKDDRLPDAEWDRRKADREQGRTVEDQVRETLDRQLPHSPDALPSREELVTLAAREAVRIAQQEAPK